MILQIIVNIKENVKKDANLNQVSPAQKGSVLSLQPSQNSVKYIS